ncbi:tubulin glycylase 3A-like [Anoplolepis gracilipes]|uniref:tubulin glycylase 3A-like n=1 Tax=Anoplolepis gracilipes TaxID=354296 RepID=UPI003B9F4B5F
MYCSSNNNNNSTICADNQSKWQITLTSKNCTIRKRFKGWQICPKSASNGEKNLQLLLTVPKLNINSQCEVERIKTVDAEIGCNRENLEELLEAEDRENNQENGNIILTEYLKLITDDEAKINFLLKILTRAIIEHKYYVICGTFPALRKPLADRGWLEKRAIRKMISISPDTYEDGLEQIEKLLQTPADFIWYTNRKTNIRADDKTIMNKFVGSYFTSKIDMCNNLENAYWFYETGVSNVQFPRCYNMYQELVTSVRNVMKTVIKYRLQSRIDGIRNIWILKPGDDSLGRGIVLKSSMVDILTKVNQAIKENTEYVVQKYIERPLLVHKTKVDIRQWFLLTSTQPLIVWMFEDILIRFASKEFTLSDFHESIHLCNTTVQLKYRKLPRCNSDLPKELHWNLQDFKNYLQSRNQEMAWEKIIRPGIKQNLIGALLASQDNMVNRKNSFQLYGADFVVADDFSVWLLEINTNPRLHPPSSEVTAKLYPEVIEDAMKVVLDHHKNKKAPCGRFECIYKQRNPFYGVNVLGQGTSLGIRGKGLFVTPKLPRDL